MRVPDIPAPPLVMRRAVQCLRLRPCDEGPYGPWAVNATDVLWLTAYPPGTNPCLRAQPLHAGAQPMLQAVDGVGTDSRQPLPN